MSTELVDSVREALDVSREKFAAAVEREARQLESELREGTFDNPQAIVGLEYELYGVGESEATLKRVPRPLLDLISFEGELGLHNAELHTNPQPLNEFGLRAQLTEAQARIEVARAKTQAEQIALVSDGLWTIPPVGESARTYLTDSVERDGVRVTTNMADATRYQAMANAPLVSMTVEPAGRFDDAFRHFEYNHGSFWRWVRPVFDGATRSSANARIEFRPLPGQPTVRDSLAFVAAFAGLMESLPRREHPVRALDWETARENFYAAMADGLDANLRWITADGEDTDDREAILTELLDYARDGLRLRGLSDSEADEYLAPLHSGSPKA